MYEHLMVALDGSPAAERVLEHAEALARAFSSRITLLRAMLGPETLLAQTATTGPGVGDVAPAMDPTPILEAEHEAATEYLDEVGARLRAHGFQIEAEHPEGDAADAIVQRARELNVDLILMTTHGRSGLGRVVFGSVADSVIRHAPCPVLLVHVTSTDEAATAS
jgi:nucleotide-binding universal stress UspA family protein